MYVLWVCTEPEVRVLRNIVEMFVEPLRILCVKRATLILYKLTFLTY